MDSKLLLVRAYRAFLHPASKYVTSKPSTLREVQILFMSGAMQHAQLSTDLYMKHGPEFDVEVLDIPEIRQIAYFRSLILKYSSVMMFAPMILGQIFFAVETILAILKRKQKRLRGHQHLHHKNNNPQP